MVKNTRISTICAQKSEKQVKKLSNKRSEIVSWIQFGDHLDSVNIDIWLLLITDMYTNSSFGKAKWNVLDKASQQIEMYYLELKLPNQFKIILFLFWITMFKNIFKYNFCLYKNHHCHFFFEEPPVLIKKPPSQVEAELGSTLKLCCVAEGSVSWSRAQLSLNLLPAFQQNGCLTITSITDESAGNYICHVTNTFGFAESSTAVIIKG